MHSGSVNNWLRRETPKHTALLTKLREKLEASLEARRVEDPDGTVSYEPADTNEFGTPSRDWCRAYQRYQNGYVTLLAEERENLKLQLLAKRGGQPGLTDEEYGQALRELAQEALRELSTDDLAREFLRRGMALPAGSDAEDEQ